MATTTQTVYSGYSATILGSSAFDRPGYELTAWGTTSTGGQLYTPGSQYTFNANTSLYAQWDYKPIEITYGTYLNASVYKFGATLGLQVTDSTGAIVHPTMLAKGLTNPSYVRACVDAGEGCVTVINNHGFCKCNNLSYVSAAKCTVVGDSAFSGCYGLKNVSLPACQTIGNNVFSFTNLETANFPSCTSIGSNVFVYCDKMTAVSLPLCSKMSNHAFHKCDLLATVYLPSMSSVDSGDFTSCPAVKTATLGVTALTGVFPDAKAVLETLTLPSCKTINTTFSGYTALKSITAPLCSKINGMQGCTTLSIASFPSCTATTNDAFKGCTALRELYLPNCTNVSGTVAESCPALWSVTLGTSGMKQFSSARSTLVFLNFTNLETLTTFSNYTALEHVDMPKCTAIAGYGFSGCTALNYVSMPLCTSIATAASAKMCPFRGATQVQATLGVTILYSEVFSQASARQLTLPNGTQFYTCAMKDQKNL